MIDYEPKRKIMNPAQKMKSIIDMLSEVKDRNVVAQKHGYCDFKGIQTYASRHGYKWNQKKQNFVSASAYAKQNESIDDKPKGRVAKVLSLIAKGMDAREIAKQLSFDSHKEMANYMRSKGYFWDMEKCTYVKRDIASEPERGDAELKQGNSDKTSDAESNGTESELERFRDILLMLEKNKTGIEKCLELKQEGLTVPRYLISGILVTKSVHMPTGLDQLTREYSREKNITQREVFEVALIEFFRRYGYKSEIDTILTT